MEILIEIIFLAIGLLLLQALVEWSLESFGKFIADVIGFGANQPKPPLWVSTVWYFCAGATLGAFSLLALPTLLISAQWLKVMNIVVTPAVVALLVTVFAAWFYRKPAMRFANTFYFAYCTALAMGLVRLLWGQQA